jgi:hypothetical protein
VLLVALADDWAARGPYAPYIPFDDAAGELRDTWVATGAPALTPRLRRRAATADEAEVARVWNAVLGVDAAPRLRAALGEATRLAIGGDADAAERARALSALVSGLASAAIKIVPKSPGTSESDPSIEMSPRK